MSRLAEIELFVALAEEDGFSAAALRLGLSQSAVSRGLKRLEDRIGVRLIARTTRRMNLTDAGHAFLGRCRQILADLAEAEDALAAAADLPRGRLRVSCASAFGRRHVVPLLPGFRRAYPGIEVDLVLDDRYVDFVGDAVDLAIRLGPPEGQGLAVRRLGQTRRILCAAPGYVAGRPLPAAPRDLEGHECLVLSVYGGRDRWRFTGPDGRPATVRVAAAIRLNDAEALRIVALGGGGITILPDYIAGQDLADGRLVEVLPDFVLPPVPIYVVLPERRLQSRRVRCFVDHLAAALRLS